MGVNSPTAGADGDWCVEVDAVRRRVGLRVEAAVHADVIVSPAAVRTHQKRSIEGRSAPLLLNALGGNDNDVVALNFMLDPASRGTVLSNVVTGGGDDAVNASFRSSLVGLLFNAELGGGNDMFAGQFLRAGR